MIQIRIKCRNNIKENANKIFSGFYFFNGFESYWYIIINKLHYHKFGCAKKSNLSYIDSVSVLKTKE